jgi:hypothetical protein
LSTDGNVIQKYSSYQKLAMVTDVNYKDYKGTYPADRKKVHE